MKIRKIISAILIATIVACCLFLGHEYMKGKQASNELEYIQNIVDKNVKNSNKEFTHDTFTELQKENSEFKGYIKFDSKIIELPIVQAKDNDKYLNLSFYGKYSQQGTPFIDAYSNLDDTNIIIYAHNVYYDDTAMFSPLTKLIDQTFYEENNKFKMYFENEVREYAITNVYYLDEETYQWYNYQQPTFLDKKEFDEWINYPDRNNLINSVNGKIESGNKFVTLSTCKKWEEDKRVIVLAKETKVTKYS